jgi:alcohol dehydrogenase
VIRGEVCMEMVRAAVLRSSGVSGPYVQTRPLAFESVALEPPGFGELRVKIRAASLCHSDLSAVNGDRPWPVPLVLGHEAAGEVELLGPGVTGFAVGDPVALVFKPFCGRCVPCLSGHGGLCEPGSAANAGARLLGGYQRLRLGATPVHHHMGVAAFAEKVVVSQHSAVKIPAGLPWEIAALFGCAVLTGAGAVFNTARVGPGDSVAVFGLGGVGCSALLAARAAGATLRVGIDVVPEKLALARDFGATHVFDARDPDVVARVRALTGVGVDFGLEMAGVVSAMDLAYKVCRRGGTMVSAGLPNPALTWPIPAVSLIAEERTVKGSYMGSSVPVRDIPRYIDLYKAGLLPVDRLLERTIRLEDLHEALDALAAGRALRQVVLFP